MSGKAVDHQGTETRKKQRGLLLIGLGCSRCSHVGTASRRALGAPSYCSIASRDAPVSKFPANIEALGSDNNAMLHRDTLSSSSSPSPVAWTNP